MSTIYGSKGTGNDLAIGQAFTSYIFKDFKTRLFVPNSVGATAILNLLSEAKSLLTGEVMGAYVNQGYSLETASAFINKIIVEVIKAPFLVLGVTNLSFSNEHVIPTTKGIGSYGELIHLLGARNEQINLSFTTEKYPSIFGGYLRKIIGKILREAQLVYIIDEMTGYIPAVMKNYKLNKSGKMIGAISGSLSFISLEDQKSTFSATVRHQLGLLKNTGALTAVAYAFHVTGWLAGLKLGLEAKDAANKLQNLGRIGIGA